MSQDNIEKIKYKQLPTIKKFHDSSATYRAIVGAVGSGKTSAASMEVYWYIPRQMYDWYNIKKTICVIVRNSYRELTDTTLRTVLKWFPHGTHKKADNIYTVTWPYKGVELEVEALFRSCDNVEDMKKFKSLEITGYWIDESIEVADNIKNMLKTRIGRFPEKSPMKYGIETTNPPDVESSTYWQFNWIVHPPEGSPLPIKSPLSDHEGFWQPPGENSGNLGEGYYENLREAYREDPEWVAVYLDSKPGIIIKGKAVYKSFKRAYHVGIESLIWSGGTLYRGWDNTGNSPACVVVQVPTFGRIQILREFYSDRMSIEEFSQMVVQSCNMSWPNAEYYDWADPAGFNKFSKRGGGFTSNAEIMEQACGIMLEPSEQNLDARISVVERQLRYIDGLLIDPSCIRLINGFIGGYHYPEMGNSGIYSRNPRKNKFSHAHDALQYVLVKLVSSEEPEDDDYEDYIDKQDQSYNDRDIMTGY